MTDLDYSITKNKLEILLLKAQEGLKVGNVTQSKLEAVETLQDSLKCMLELRLIVDEMKNKQTLLTMQNVKAYKETAELKKKFNTLHILYHLLSKYKRESLVDTINFVTWEMINPALIEILRICFI